MNIAVFGCWNRGCENGSGQQAVAQLIKSREQNYKFMTILGDNYYAKQKKIGPNDEKIYDTNLEELKNGFECFSDIKLEKKLIMGNHDVVESYDKYCSVLKNQLKIPWYDIKFPYAFDLYYVKNNANYETILFIYLLN